MRKYLLLVVALLALAALVGPVAQAAAPNGACGYVYVNDDNYTGVNSVSVLSCNTANNPPLTFSKRVNSTGNGAGGGYFAADRIKILQVANTLFVNDSGSGLISMFDVSSPGSPVLKNSFNDGMPGDASFVAGGKCLVAEFNDYGLVNSYSVSNFSLTQVSSISATTSGGIAAAKVGTSYYVAWGSGFAGYSYATIDGTCKLGAATFVGGIGGEAGVALSGGYIYMGLANGSSATLEYGKFPGGALTTVSYTNGGLNSNNVIVDPVKSCAYLSASWGAPITGVPLGLYAIQLTGGVPSNTATWVPDNTNNYYQGPPAFRAALAPGGAFPGIAESTTSGTNLVTQYMTGKTCGSLTYKGYTNTTMSGPYSMSLTWNPQGGF